MIKKFSKMFVVSGMSLAAGVSLAQTASVASNQSERPDLGQAEGMVMLDYEIISVPGNKAIDLMGFHFFSKMNDWVYLGVGGYAPLFKGEYGGFMALDVTAHVQRKIFGNFFADAGVSMGGGGGGKSVEQSKILSGTGGFVKAYIGLGHESEDFSVGVNIARMKFQKSAIDNSQFNIYVQLPFSYATGSYASAGEKFFPADKPGAAADSSENTLTLGLDNFRQIRPEGLNKNTINVAELQFSHFMSKNSYWYVNAGVGYHGLPLYNQVLGGLGYRVAVSSRINLQGQVALGSGGYAPETINTGPGLLVYPRISAEYLFDRNFGLSLSAGYLFAPRGSSRNYSVGASLNYHILSGPGNPVANDAAEGLFYRGYRINLFPQTEFNVKDRGRPAGKINLVAVQLDNVVSDHVYIPIQTNVAYNAYLDYPGYGELLAGVGVQNKHDKDGRFQLFGQLLVGTNSHGPIVKTGVGLNYGLSDRFAIYGLAGQTFSVDREKFRSDYIGLGVTYRFSVPGR